MLISCLGFGEAEKNIFGAETDFQPMPEKLVLPKNTFVTNNNNCNNNNSQLGWKKLQQPQTQHSIAVAGPINKNNWETVSPMCLSF